MDLRVLNITYEVNAYESLALVRKFRGLFLRRLVEAGHAWVVDGRLEVPTIQFKMHDGRFVVQGIGKGADTLTAFIEVPSRIEIKEGDISWLSPLSPSAPTVSETLFPFGEPVETRYRVLTPCCAINQKSSAEFVTLPVSKRDAYLAHKVTGCLLGLSSAVGFSVPHRLRVEVTSESQEEFKFGDEFVWGFTGEIKVNLALPPLCGIGGKTSFGYGAVMPIGGS